MKKVMLLAAMLAMVLAAAVPALAQSVNNNVTQVGEGNIACVQTAIQQEFGKTQIAVSQYGDATNINIQNIAQECNISVSQVNAFFASATASASASASASATAPAAVQYQYAAPEVQYSATASPTASAAAELPPTGGSSLIALGAGVLLVAGGLLARRLVR